MKREHLIIARKTLGMTQEDVAKISGIHRSYYSLIEIGQRNPTLKIAIKIATALNNDIEHLFPDEIFFASKCYNAKQIACVPESEGQYDKENN